VPLGHWEWLTHLNTERSGAVALSERVTQPVVVDVPREIDLSNADELQARIALARTESTSERTMICLDFGRCEFIDSTGLQVVVHAARALRERGGELSAINLTGQVARVFETVGLLVDGSAVILWNGAEPSAR